MEDIEKRYTEFYSERKHIRVYPTEFVVRTFLANYPELKMSKLNVGDKVLDVGCGDGRNSVFLCEQGYDVYATEITQEICGQTQERVFKNCNSKIDIKVGKNSSLPYDDNFFDCILACHSCYYCEEGETIIDNLKEYSRVLKKNGVLIASVVHSDSYILAGGKREADGTTTILNDPYNNRNGYRLHSFANVEDIKDVFSEYFENFSIGQGHNNWFGIDENVWWVVCYKK